MQMLITILAFIIAIIILVAVHEYGHFLVAKCLKVRVLTFSIGFGRALYSRKLGDTTYTLAAIPIGGYVRMLDERDGPLKEEDKPYAFNQKPLWVRVAVILGGPLANILFAVLVYWLLFMVGMPGIKPVIGDVERGSIAAMAGLKPKQEIVAVNNEKTPTWVQLQQALLTEVGSKQPIILVTESSKEGFVIHTVPTEGWALNPRNPQPIESLGIKPFTPKLPQILAQVVPGGAAAQAGFKPGDKVIAVEGKKVGDWKAMVDYVKVSPNKPLRFSIERKGDILTLTATPHEKKDSKGRTYGMLGVRSTMVKLPADMRVTARYGVFAALGHALVKTKDLMQFSFLMLGKMVSGDLSPRSLAGPVSIAKWAGTTANAGWVAFLKFLALISVSLAVVNLLPIPMLDGGHLVFYLYEAIFRKPLSETLQYAAYRAGFLLLAGVFLFVFYNDLMR